LIHQSQAGALIGKGASRVKEFREKRMCLYVEMDNYSI